VAQHFVNHYAKKMSKPVPMLSAGAMKVLMGCRWVGNVRELQHAIERAVVLTTGDAIEASVFAELNKQSTGVGGAVGSDAAELLNVPYQQAKEAVVRAFERRYLSKMLERTSGNISQAALAAGLDRSNFKRAMKECGLRDDSGE
jgi:two-component system response regulator HydG